MVNGIINVYKEAGFTSFDVVAKLRGIMKQKKIGHTGTLDPDATGVLPVCFGSATKLVDMLTDRSKAYEAEMLLGITTDTQDISGQILEKKKVDITEEELRSAILSFIGKQQQLPPMYSALKINGQKLCDLARKGIEVERKPREIEIFNIEVVDITKEEILTGENADASDMVDITPNSKNNETVNITSNAENNEAVDITYKARMIVECSKGTYIRTLCHDIGQALGCGGVMTSLKRIRSGEFTIDRALTLDEIEKLVRAGDIDKYIIPVDACFKDYPALKVQGETYKRVLNGNQIKLNPMGEHIRVYGPEGEFMAVYESLEKDNIYTPEKMFLS